MARQRSLSPPARRVLDALRTAGEAGQHGYDLCQEAGVQSGTLYPLLMRLEAQGYLTAIWRPSEIAGRPPRHVYRLNAEGRRLAADNPVIGDVSLVPAGRPA